MDFNNEKIVLEVVEEEGREKELLLLAQRISNHFQDSTERFFREGILIEKGVQLSEDHLLKNESLLKEYFRFFSAYPDLFIDLITPRNSNFTLYFYQRIFLRACMRYRYIYGTAPRAFSKSFIAILALFLKCIFQPGAKLFICAPIKEQGAKIATEKIKELFTLFPILKNEIIGEGNFGRDYVQLTHRNGSILDVVGALDSTRGRRRHGGLIDETRDHDGQIIAEVVLPLMNVSRKTAAGIINPYEKHQAQFYLTSAGSKSSFAYEKLLEVLQMAVIQPNNAFIFGCDYRVSMMHGLLDSTYVNEMKMSPTFNEETFAREMLGIWTGGSEASWFSFDKLTKHRILVNPETKENFRGSKNQFYLFSVDVGRTSDQTVLTIFKITVVKGRYFSSIVNIFVIASRSHTKTFDEQARDIKEEMRVFDPQEIVIDANGLGVGLVDAMLRTQISKTGYPLDPCGCFNDKDYLKTQPQGIPKKIYALKASNSSLLGKIHGNCYARINSGLVKFLVKEQEAKTKLLSTEVGRKMGLEDRVKRIMPHEMTTKLIEEMANLRLKASNGSEISLEKINSRHPKDKFSSLEYGLWRINELEGENSKKEKRSNSFKNRQLVFYSGE